MGGSAIILNPHTGEILAMANEPTFNPNAFRDADENERRNRAVQDLYEPGSTFKVVTASAAIEEKVMPVDALIDVLPSTIAFGLGMSMVVAPLTSTLMGSVPGRNSGLGSAINNALSRVGQPLIGAVIFVAINASFYAALADRVPGLDPADPAVHARIVPLNPPAAGTPDDVVAAAKAASVDAFHLAALVSAGLLVAGAVTSGIGLRSRATAPSEVRSSEPAIGGG